MRPSHLPPDPAASWLPASARLDESFSPPRWLRNRHIQTIVSSLPARFHWMAPRLARLAATSRTLLLDCGDGVRLQAFHSSALRTNEGRTPSKAAARVVVLLHGWEGSADSLYSLALAAQLSERGCEVVRLNLRDHGGTQHLNRELFHSCRLPEVIGAVRHIQALFPGAPLGLAGFSLGGNFMLRVAAEARTERLEIEKVVAISPVLDPVATLEALERGFHPYHSYFIRKWTRSLRLKQQAWPEDYDFAPLVRVSGLRALTAELVRGFTNFASLEAYLNGYAIVGTRLAPLAVPSTIITSLDDPIIPARDIARLAPSPALRVVVTRWGGHCGFLDHPARSTWAERRAAAELAPARELASAAEVVVPTAELGFSGAPGAPEGASLRSSRSADR
ncbi:MAG TPA: alpha/beta fold hydrolase [Steroidobacteraceae bacterium]|nr:alpha/beta fold hydrolase [Steroidobacteraceae bacterium]